MSVPGAMTQAVAHVERTVGPLDVLVNNAAVPSPTGPAWELDPAVWWDSVQTNVHGTYLSTRAALTVMVPRRRGRVVTVVSHAGKAVWPHVSAYSVAKAAIIKLTENVAAETRSHGVRMFAYHPGLMDIGMSRQNAIDALTGNEWDRKVAAWFAKVKANGGLTPVPLACAVLVRLAGGDLDALSGRYVTVDDDLDALLAEAARPAAR
jgi:NAD(P)-dependent dehydrogenase (short-subunit alcohol dehydrogenase family)